MKRPGWKEVAMIPQSNVLQVLLWQISGLVMVAFFARRAKLDHVTVSRGKRILMNIFFFPFATNSDNWSLI